MLICNKKVDGIFLFSTWKTGSHCSKALTASDLPTTIPFLSMPKYLPYPDFKVIFVSPTGKAVKISSGEGGSPEVEEKC